MILHPHQFAFSAEDSQLLQSVLNEVLHGFAVDNRDVLIGMNESELEQLLIQLNQLPNAAGVELNLIQTRAFRNALRETLKELGIEEFHTRTGFDFEEGEDAIKRLDQIIQVVDGGNDEQ